jgi:osmotically-inducible protein OsmY
MSTTLTILDQRLRDAVMHQLDSDPQVDASLVGVSAQEGVVTLSGYVNSYAEKLAAERSCRRVFGVKALANELEVRIAVERIDPEIARQALDALKNRIDVPLGIAVTIRNGHLTLSGVVEWMYQRAAAERAVKYLRGVKGVFNQITLSPTAVPKDVQKRIVDSLHRHADIDARRIHVEAEGSRVTLSGTVRSWMEKDEAQRAAWRVPGVAVVDNRISVVP